MTNSAIHVADTLDWCREQPDNSVDLVLCSPPYEAARTYGIDFNLRGQEWVDWAVERFREHVRICRGLVAWVVEGQTRQFCWSATPALLMADLHRAGIKLRKPPIFHRVGIPGSGGPDWWRNDFEFVVCATKGRLPWAEPTATGKPCKWAPGGEMSYRHADGQRINAQLSKRNQYGGTGRTRERRTNGERKHTKRTADGMRTQTYVVPALANPGNVIRCKVGGGVMGSPLAHENEAPFPESLVEPFVLSFCPPGGLVYDPFCGSGTTGAVALRHGRKFVGTDVRESQVELTRRRIGGVQVRFA